MSKLFLKRDGYHLVPIDQESLVALKKLPKDKPLSCEIKRTRNYQFHKKFMAMVKIGCDNSKMIDKNGVPITFDAYRKYITIKAGFYKLYQTEKGNYIEPESISFGSMKAERFEIVYKKVLDQVCIDIGTTSEEIERSIIEFM